LAYRSSAPLSDRRSLLAIRDSMANRGPDGSGVWWSECERVGLAHRRLAIIDLDDRALQPMSGKDGCMIVFNGEIYNYRALRKELSEAYGICFATQSDTEVLLALFALEGPSMVHKLRGMFAFAIWDPSARRLFLARDPYGIKPLYYAQAGGRFFFASQVRALKLAPGLSTEADPAGMVGFQLTGSVPEPFTLFRAIKALPAGSTLFVDEMGAGEPERFASVAAVLATAMQDRLTPVNDRIAEAALDSVRSHLVSDVEVGAFLSSGVDSGSLVGLMRDAGQSRIRAITLAFEELRGTLMDEAPLAVRIAQLYGAEHYVRTVTKDEFTSSAEQILADMDQPSVDGVNTWFVSKAAHECGLKVVLSGLGGDELLGGYSTFQTVPRMRRIAGAAAAIPFAPQLGKTILRRFAPEWLRRNPKMLGVLDYADSWAGSYMLRRAVLLPFELDRKLDGETIREGLERLRPLASIADTMEPDPGSDVARVSALESANYMRNQLLRDSDWASMAHSLELRVPYVDWPTLNRIAPISSRLRPGVGKKALAQAPSVPLPQDCLTRARTGFNVPVANWIGASSDPGSRLASRHWSGRVAAAFGLNADAAA
jgi:asparagine synthase (glutamine-hydrolysing)